MNLLTADQLDAASMPDIYDTLRALNELFRIAEQAEVLEAAVAWLAASNVPYVARLVVETESYENGYVYENATAQDSNRTTAWLPPGVDETLQTALRAPLVDLSYPLRPLDFDDVLVIDLRAGTLTQSRRRAEMPEDA
jgi:hypothetical protein